MAVVSTVAGGPFGSSGGTVNLPNCLYFDGSDGCAAGTAAWPANGSVISLEFHASMNTNT